MSYQRWFHQALLSSLVFIGGLSLPLARPSFVQATPAGDGKHSFIRVEAGMVSVKIAGVSLEEVLREISVQSRIRLVLHGSQPEKVYADFQRVPLEEALRRLIRENYFLLYSPGPDGRVAEVWVLRGPRQHLLLEESDSFASLLAELQERDAGRRGRAALFLGELHDERALEPVIGVLREDEDADVRQRAIWALEDLGGQQAVAALIDAVSGDSDDSVRQRAVEAVAKVGGDEAVEPLTWALRNDPDPFVRYEALVNLAEIGGDRALGSLLQALHDPDELILAKGEEILDSGGTAW
jgi:hypothetical protein